MGTGSDEIPSVRDNFANNVHDGFDVDDDGDNFANNVHDVFDVDDDEAYDADDEMDVGDAGYIEDHGADNDYGIQIEDNVNEVVGVEENEIDEILFAISHQEPNNENEDNTGSFVYNEINISHINSQEVLENDYINVENENIDIEE